MKRKTNVIGSVRPLHDSWQTTLETFISRLFRF